jgi:flagellar biosynthesis protein FlhA
VIVGEGEAFPGMLMAINPGHITQALPGTKTTDPAFGLPAIWIDERSRDLAMTAGYTVVDCATVIATHLHHLMQVHAARLMGRAEAQQLLEHLAKHRTQAWRGCRAQADLGGGLQRVLQNLLDDSVMCATCAASSRPWPSTVCGPRIPTN